MIRLPIILAAIVLLPTAPVAAPTLLGTVDSHLRYPHAPSHRDVGSIGQDHCRADGTVIADLSEVYFINVEVKRRADLSGADNKNQAEVA